MQSTWMQTQLRDGDGAIHVCGPGDCDNATLKSKVVIDEDFEGCEKNQCNDYMKSGVKLPAGLTYMHQQLEHRKMPMPAWWVMKDDDTWIDARNLNTYLERYDPADPIMIGGNVGGCPGLCGGAGVVVSWRLAAALASHGRQWVDGIRHSVIRGSGDWYWDLQLPAMAKHIEPRTEVIYDKSFHTWGPYDEPCLSGAKPSQYAEISCYTTAACKCAFAAKPISFHIKVNFNDSIQKLTETGC